MHPYSDKLPELNNMPLKSLCDSREKLIMFEDIDQDLVYIYVLNKLAACYGGFHHFWDKEENKALIMQAWKLGINDLTPRQVFAGLYRIMSADPFYLLAPPKHVIGFKFVCLDSKIHDSILDRDVKLEYTPPPCSESVSKENLAKIRAILKEAIGKK